MHGIPWIYSAILAFEGQVSVFNMPLNDDSTTTTAAAVSRGPDYRDLLPTPPDPGDVPSCAEGGVLGVLPGTMGCIQATEAIKLILGHTVGLLVGRVLVFDAMAMKFSEIGLSRTPDRVPIVSLIDYQGFCGGPKQQQSQITPPMLLQSPPGAAPVRRTMDEADANEDADATTTTSEMAANSFRTISPRDCWDKLRNEEWTPWVVDVRLETEHVICHLPFTDCVIPHRRILEPHARMPSTGDVLVYCKAGSRGATACRNLVASGRIEPNRLYNLQGGILQWQKDIDPSIPRY